MKLRSHAGGFSTERTDEIFERKRPSDNKAIDKKENWLNKNNKLRAQNRSDSEKKLSNQNFKKLSRKNNKSENKVANYAVELDTKGKENKIKKIPKRATSQKCLNIKSCSPGSSVPLQEKNNFSLENRQKVTDIITINSNLEEKRCVTRKKNIGGEKIIKHTEKLPIWQRKPNITETKCGVKRKSFVDIYDISQDEDMSNETKHKKKKVNPRKNVKKTANKNKCLIISSENTNFNKNSNTSKPAQNKLNKLAVNQLLNDIGSNPPTVKISTPAFSSDKKLEVILSANNVEENSQNHAINKNLDVSADNIEKDSQNYVINNDDLDVTSEHLEMDNVCMGTKSDAKKFLLNLADELEKSVIIPRMTSTPDSTLLNGHVIQHLPSNKLLGLNISSVHPKSKKCLKIPVKISNSLSFKGAEITLFESPVKSKTKNPVKLRSPKKNIQINLFNNFTEQSKIDDLENSVIEPKKAYHSPDNFKTHLARAKRISEVIKRDAKMKTNFFILEVREVTAKRKADQHWPMDQQLRNADLDPLLQRDKRRNNDRKNDSAF